MDCALGYLIGMARLVRANVLRYFVKLTRDCIDNGDTGTHEQTTNLRLDQPRRAGTQEAKKATVHSLPSSLHRNQL